MESLAYHFSLLSETFAHGAYQTQNFNRPELRAPSVKGMIRWWHQALGFSPEDARTIFGQVSDRRNGIEGNFASRITIRVSPVTDIRLGKADFMPHKGAQGGAKTAIQPGTQYSLLITERREPLPQALWNQVKRATEAWLLLGAIGQRSNRAAGCPWPVSDAPQSKLAYLDACRRLLEGTRVRCAILDFSSENPRKLRDIAGRFPNTRDYNIAGLIFGSAVPRKPSPLKLRMVSLEGGLHLVAVWAPMSPHEDTIRNLESGLETMSRINGKGELAALLRDALPSLAS